MTRIAKWTRLLVRWAKILAGKSYYHKPQSLGKRFRPNELTGYFNDLTGKTRWTGVTDGAGIPMNILQNGRNIYFATTVIQKALGHWDRWLLTRDEIHQQAFLNLVRWLLARQDTKGGWDIGSALGVDFLSPYSAMVQGECASAFVRAWRLTEDRSFLERARHAVELMLKPIREGGTALYDGEDLFLEEYCTVTRSTVLNGWVFALFGLYDYWMATGEDEVLGAFQRSLRTLKDHLHEYDAGWWSYYDVQKRLASPFYHDLHIHQLHALSLIDAEPQFKTWYDKWMQYKQKRSNKAKALIVKGFQKLREPGEAVILR